ncbi:MAG: hypothetical protein A2Y62_00085 [Candidatus Fischerbacteria bacterium RBG_13_37_8]|uniref:Uncharacterized protein n=1 Tax=Candidatus Fischerbacteria bacterium RBG_13_37_8 TaxID=1817863 RepID=A0A1F5V7U7_9BACT|nr:MAG: hypothetical protein A2Y62_00085 [Candidatus Fischerbacteria bacterium RBG_13_37_8]
MRNRKKGIGPLSTLSDRYSEQVKNKNKTMLFASTPKECMEFPIFYPLFPAPTTLTYSYHIILSYYAHIICLTICKISIILVYLQDKLLEKEVFSYAHYEIKTFKIYGSLGSL